MAYARVVSDSKPHPDASDAELVACVVNGNDNAFEHIMRRYNRLLFRTARSVIDTDCEAEEVLQEAYLKAWLALSRFRADAKLSTWLVRIVLNEALGRKRRKSAHVVPLNSETMMDQSETQPLFTTSFDSRPDHHVVRAELRSILEARIGCLPEMYRTVFMLRAVEEMTTGEVSYALQLPEATVRTRFFRARSLLREGLASDVDAILDEVFYFDGERCDRIVGSVLDRIKTESGNR